jgi:putative oxidoreductase
MVRSLRGEGLPADSIIAEWRLSANGIRGGAPFAPDKLTLIAKNHEKTTISISPGGSAMPGMLEGVAARTFAPLLLRAALAGVFIFHGLEKVRTETSYGLKWADAMPGAPPVLINAPPLQLLVAWGELLCGVALALGILTRIAALGLLVIMCGAVFTYTGQHGFSAVENGYEYNFVLILVCAALLLTGAGTFSLDRVIKVDSRKPAQY